MFNKMSLGAKVTSMPVAISILMIGVFVWLIPYIQNSLYDEKRLKTQHLVQAAAGVAEHYAQEVQAGRLSREQAQAAALATLKDLRYGDDDYFWVNDLEPKMIMHPISQDLNGKNMTDFKDPEGKRVFVEMAKVVKAEGAGFVDYLWAKPGHDRPVPKISYVQGVPAWNWVVGSGIYVDDVQAQVWRMTTYIGVVLIFVFGLTIIGGWALARSITRPVKRTALIMEDIAEGDGDLTVRLETKSKDEIGRMAQAFNRFVIKIQDVVTEVIRSSKTVSLTSEEISTGNQDLSQRVQEQASAIEETAATIEEMTSSIKQNAENAGAANDLAKRTAELAVEGGQVVNEAINAMGRVAESSRKINDIVDMVNEIAFQTNLLALNASVEAARAGEAGRGFAVVAGEVRSLASRSAEAAKEIQGLIKESVSRVDEGNDLVGRSGDTLKEIIANVQRVAETISEITTANREQSTAIDQINLAIGQLDEVTQQNASLVEETAAASENMSAEAVSLSNLVGQFKVDDSAPAAGALDRPRPAKSNKMIAGPDADEVDGFETF